MVLLNFSQRHDFIELCSGPTSVVNSDPVCGWTMVGGKGGLGSGQEVATRDHSPLTKADTFLTGNYHH